MKKNYLPLSILLLLILFSCKKKQEEIPLVTVNIDVSLTNPSFVDLNAIGGWVYITGGVQGIIIYRKTQNEFLSFERNCPYKPNDACARVNMESNNVAAKDDCCGSEFSITDNGAVIHGPSTRVLKQYATYLHGNIIHIEN